MSRAGSSLAASQPDRKQHPTTTFDPNQAFRGLRRAMAGAGLPETVWPPAFVPERICDTHRRSLVSHHHPSGDPLPRPEDVAAASA